MSIYHCSIKIGSRSSGKSAVASSAYRSGKKLIEQETGLVHDYTRKQGVVYTEILLPEHAPKEYQNRENLWNAVQSIEKQKNAQLYREVEVALPIEFTREQQIEVVRQYVKKQFVKAGMCADFALHDKGTGNPHAHIMLTTRPIKANGEWGSKEKKAYQLDENGERIPIIDSQTGKQKTDKQNRKQWKRETVQANDWNDQSKAEIWRQAWADECNQCLEMEKQIDHRSYERQGIELEPTKHIGVVQQHMKEKGKELDYDITAINQQIKQQNLFMQQIREAMYRLYELIKQKLRELYERIADITRSFGYVGTTGEITYHTGTTRERNRATHERVRELETLMQKTTGKNQEINRFSTITIKQKEEEQNARIAKLLERRLDTVTRRNSDGERTPSERELHSKANDFRIRADRAISDRKNRDMERERQAIAEREARKMALREQARRAREREIGYD